MSHTLQRTIIVKTATLALATWLATAPSFAKSRAHARKPINRRIAHARELMGSYYNHSVVKKGEKIHDIRSRVFSLTRQSMKGKNRKYAYRVAKTILEESKKYGYDPIFLLAVIKNESGFNPTVRGTSGEIGLMQILPSTAEWLKAANRWKWKNTESVLRDPVMNVRIGSAYIDYLRKQFDSHGRLYLSAYNMGPGNLKTALSHKVWPKEYSIRVMEKYIQYYREIGKIHGARLVSLNN
jgi:soluble lytic murein transglycosylase